MEPRHSQRSNFVRNRVRYGSLVGNEHENALAFVRLPFRGGASPHPGSSRSTRVRHLLAVLDEKARLAAAVQALRAAQLEDSLPNLLAERELSELRLAVEAARFVEESLMEEDEIHARVEEVRATAGSKTLCQSPPVEEQVVVDHLPVLPIPGRVTPVRLPQQTLSPCLTVGERTVVDPVPRQLHPLPEGPDQFLSHDDEDRRQSRHCQAPQPHRQWNSPSQHLCGGWSHSLGAEELSTTAGAATKRVLHQRVGLPASVATIAT